jgi:hypothetical protein
LDFCERVDATQRICRVGYNGEKGIEAMPVDIDEWARAMNELCADSSPEDEETMRRAIEEHRQQAKAQVRREMGLPDEPVSLRGAQE